MKMKIRKATLLLSAAISIAMHAAFFAVAPDILFASLPVAGPKTEAYYPVSLKTEPPAEAVETGPVGTSGKGAAPRLSSRPGSVADLIERPEDDQAPLPASAQGPAEVPKLEDRAARDVIAREHDLAQAPQTSDRIDAKILEIDESLARKDIQVARRFVRPSPERIVAENELPVLRSATAPEDAVPARLANPPDAGLAQAMNAAPGPAPATEKPRLSEALPQLVASVPQESQPVPLPSVRAIETKPIDREVAAAKKESGEKYGFMDDLVDIKLDTYRRAGEELGYFRLIVAPKSGQKIAPLPKDIVFVIDASGSIGQRKLDMTVRGVQEAIRSLRPEDRFNVNVFRETSSLFQPDKVPATDANKAAALAFLKPLQSSGETDVYQGILPVVQEKPRPGVPSIVMVISDGKPTKGLRDGRIIINGLTTDNSMRNSIFAFGGGRTVNRSLLDLLAYQNKGRAKVADTPEALGVEFPKFFAQLEDPLLVGLHADYGQIDPAEIYPKAVPDFYRGQEVRVYGRFDPKKDAEFVTRLAGKAGEKNKEILFRATLQSATAGEEDVARGWAFEKAYSIIGDISRLGETPERIEALRALSRDYGLRTSYDE